MKTPFMLIIALLMLHTLNLAAQITPETPEKKIEAVFEKGKCFAGISSSAPIPSSSIPINNIYNSWHRIGIGLFPVKRFAVIPEIGLQLVKLRSANNGDNQVQSYKVLTAGSSAKYFFLVDPLCGAFSTQLSYNIGQSSINKANLTHQVGTELGVTKPFYIRSINQILQLDAGVGIISNNLNQKRGTHFMLQGRLGVNYCFGSSK